MHAIAYLTPSEIKKKNGTLSLSLSLSLSLPPPPPPPLFVIEVIMAWIYILRRLAAFAWPLAITRKLFNLFFFFCHTGHAYGHIDFYHFIPFSLTLIMIGGHKVSSTQNIWASFSRTLFKRLGINLFSC